MEGGRNEGGEGERQISLTKSKKVLDKVEHVFSLRADFIKSRL